MSQNSKQSILITGCSSGFGLLTAAYFSNKNYHVYATMRNLSKQNELLSEVNRVDGKISILPLDVTDVNSIKSVISKIAEKHGNLDILVNNAGYGIGGFFEDLSDQEIRDQMETNFFGVLNLIRECIPLMRPKKQGKIINISSVAGFSASPAFGAYNASKWALEAFSESMLYELALFGIDLHLVQPGPYKTEIFYKNARYAEKFDDKSSPYFEYSQSLKNKVYDFLKDNHKDPMEIPLLVEKIIEGRKKSFRCIPDFESKIQYALRKFLPFIAYKWIIQTALMKKISSADNAFDEVEEKTTKESV